MKRLFAALIALLLLPAACAEEAAASLSAGAVVSMHNAVMRDVLGSDFELTLAVGEDELFRLYTDGARREMFMVGFDETDKTLAATVVIQNYDIADFRDIALNSLRAVCLPFMTDDEAADFDIWLAEEAKAIAEADAGGADMNYNYFEGGFLSCAISLYHDGEKKIFTAVVAWEHPLSADEITLLMSEEETDRDE